MCDGLSWTVLNSNDECLVTKTCDDKIEEKKTWDFISRMVLSVVLQSYKVI